MQSAASDITPYLEIGQSVKKFQTVISQLSTIKGYLNLTWALASFFSDASRSAVTLCNLLVNSIISPFNEARAAR